LTGLIEVLEKLAPAGGAPGAGEYAQGVWEDESPAQGESFASVRLGY